MHAGLDLDNTIICYDEVFHNVGIEQGWIKNDCPPSKSAVKDAILRDYDNNVWTELQGVVYGKCLNQASPYPGVMDFIASCISRNWSVSVISHKTQYPAVGDRVDLRVAAESWLEMHGISTMLKALSFCDTRAEKVKQIKEQNCQLFIDDLTEIFEDSDFPQNVRSILFDPKGIHPNSSSWIRAQDWHTISEHTFQSK